MGKIKKISLSNDNIQTIDRRNFYQLGLSNKDTYFANGNIRYIATGEMRKCTICNLKLHKYNWKQIMTHVDSKHSNKGNSKIDWIVTYGKKNIFFPIGKELAFGGMRLRMVYNEDIHYFDKLPKCTSVYCPYETKDNERILGHLPKHNEIERKWNLLCPYFPHSFSKLYTLTRHLYETSCPHTEE